jgi:arginyl-tRNA synthetase
MQYSHARICSIERNCGFELEPEDCDRIHVPAIDCEEGLRLVLMMSAFDDILLRAYHEHDSSVLTAYLFNLSHNVNKAYKVLQVKDMPRPIGSTRLLLFKSSKNILRKGMTLLGIKPLSVI